MVVCSIGPNSFIANALFVVLIIALIFVLLWAVIKKLSFLNIYVGSFILHFQIFSLGYLLFYFSDARNYQGHFQEFNQEETVVMQAVVTAPPNLKAKSVSTELDINSIKDSSGQWNNCHGKLKADFELDSFSIGLQYGDVVIIRSKLSPIKGPENPHAFDAANFFGLKGIFHQTYIRSKHTLKLEKFGGQHWYKTLLEWRKRLLGILAKHLQNYPNEKAVASALLLGSKSDFNPELRNAYADAGVTHVLAVSGLHVGLVAWLLGFMLRSFSRKKSKGSEKWNAIVLISIIWIYVLLTGATPSVLRSGLMFSFVMMATVLNRKINIYNSLASSAFLLLCIQPKMLFDLGFQLSYLALFGIVFYQPIIYKIIYFKNKTAENIWKMTAAGFAAQLVTAPISLFYFHQFPFYFWLSGLMVVPLATAALYSGIFLFFTDWIPYVGDLMGYLSYLTLALMNSTVYIVQKLPFSVITGFWIENHEMYLWYLVLFLMTFASLYKLKYYVFTAIALSVFLVGLQLNRIIASANQSKIYVYKVNRSLMMDFVSGFEHYTLSDSILSSVKMSFANKNNMTANRVFYQKAHFKLGRDSISSDNLFLDKMGIGSFEGVTFALPGKEMLNATIINEKALDIDFLIISGNPKIRDFERLEQLFNFRYLVFDASNSPYRIDNWKKLCDENNIPYIDCSNQGREIINFKKKI